MNLGLEDEFTEFKVSLAQLDKGLRSITAMLNKHGEGNVYFGVSDNGDVIGMDIGKDTLMDIRNRIRDRIEPRIYADIKDYTDDNGKKYIKVSAKGTDIPYSYDGRYYVRNVSADEQASNDILRKMLASSDADMFTAALHLTASTVPVSLCTAIRLITISRCRHRARSAPSYRHGSYRNR